MGEAQKCRRSWGDLPDDCWEAILSSFDHHRHFRPMSLVSKRFHAMTNHLRTTLTIPSPNSSIPFPPSHLYSRFPNLKSLHFCHRHPDLDALVRQLASSSLTLQSLRLSRQPRFPREAMRLLGRSASVRNTLTSLSCTSFDRLTDDDVFVVADCFSYLQCLELSQLCPKKRVTDRGIRAISTKLTALLSLNIWCDERVSSQSLHFLYSNCPLLSDLRAKFNPGSSVCLHHFSSFASTLSSLSLHRVNITETGLAQLSAANFKLWKLILAHPQFSSDVNGATICRFLKSCRSLRYLGLAYFDFPPDTMALDFAASIPNIEEFNLWSCGHLPESILFHLLKNCPNLEEIITNLTSMVGTIDDSISIPVRHRVRDLVMTGWGLTDKTLMLIGSVCPNLEVLIVDPSSDITEQGIEAIRTSCCRIKRLVVTDCSGIDLAKKKISHMVKVEDVSLDEEFSS